MEILETDRLLLRIFTPEIQEQLFRQLSEPELIDYLGIESEEDLQCEKRKWKEGIKGYNRSLCIFNLLDKSTQHCIGWCGYHTWYLPHSRAEIGYVLTDKAYWGKKLMKEALPAILQYGFSVLKLKRIEAFVAAEPGASMHLLKSSGFREEGRLRKHYCVNGKLEDSVLLALLEAEWKSSKKTATGLMV